jgi:GWxTD domain-containing protein
MTAGTLSRVLPRIALAVTFMTAAAGCPLFAQPEQGERAFVQSERKSFAVDVLTYPGDSAGSSRVDVYLEVPYHSLQFVNQGGFFRASYELSVEIRDTTGRLITEKVWSGRMEVDSIQEVRLKRPGEIVQKPIAMAPGRYNFHVKVRDLETDRETGSRLRVTVPDYAHGKWKVSDAMLLRSLESEGERKVIVPNIGAAISDVSDSFYVFFKLYNDLGADSGLVITSIGERGTAPARTDTQAVPLRPGENSLLPRISCPGLGVGEYTLSVRAVPAGGMPADSLQAMALAETERTFTVKWLAAPIEVTDIDAAIDQMQYIVEKEIIDELKELPAGERRDRWADYWKKKDPTPGTDRNELMEEYYSRVEYANKHFGHYTQGWKTDMGMVYIIFGSPSNIERHPFEIDSKPYEIWTYYELNRQFIFVDATGFGDYRLQTPIWDVYQTRPR